jgi:L,D-transpeptidase-like protein
MHALRSLGLAAAVLLASASSAAAQTPTPTPSATATPVVPVPTPTVTPPPPPAAAKGRLKVKVKGGLKDSGKRYVLSGDKVKVKGRLRPAVTGQRVQIQLSQAGGKRRTRKVSVNRAGRFSLPLRLKGTGSVAIRAIHKKSGKIKRAASKRTHLRALKASSMGWGSSGPLAALFQRELRQMRYPAPRSGVYDDATGRAVMAYRKVNGLPRTYSPSGHIVKQVLAGKGEYEVRWPELGKHVEADLSLQIIALVEGDKLIRVYHTSSGAPATPTVLGTFRFYSQTYGTNSHGMVHSNYFIRGYAIHGYADVPPYNASHGCLRIPIPDAYTVFTWINLGDQIRVVP